ncbi:hypothetical protein NYZ99_09645 [Maribacter litopenaei]|uniref:Lipoprotein n=1 Tax=Maribacter litopenaei TaxID=2976127 RepID=A0ABY5YBJ9_9FLAO|nr:hypothetical protein [Maribacter litopenaei]UWX56423.1 hypothetical protein NYZ99_09645 [Maribacter litopenaei]
MKRSIWFLLIALLVIACKEKEKQNENTVAKAPEKLKALILDGQNNHYVRPKTTMMMKDFLEETQLFEVAIHRMDSVWLGIKYNESGPEAYTSFIETYPLDSTKYGKSSQSIKTSDFSIDFEQYDVIISNLGAESPLWRKLHGPILKITLPKEVDWLLSMPPTMLGENGTNSIK